MPVVHLLLHTHVFSTANISLGFYSGHTARMTCAYRNTSPQSANTACAQENVQVVVGHAGDATVHTREKPSMEDPEYTRSSALRHFRVHQRQVLTCNSW